MNLSNQIIFDFKESANIDDWKIVDDVVMGGKSNGNFKLNDAGKGEFYGRISLDNNGGFSSLRNKNINFKNFSYTEVVLKVKGDGKKYQFRLKDNLNNAHSYIMPFTTSGEWQTIKIKLSEMYPAFRGRKLSIGNFSANSIAEIVFLIGNKKQESFSLEMDKIYLQ
ncbi:CIA30 family protein [uncultured Polaribacter sp.]|uniref:CIA30 family protein n=1 Tax=uncultured Polaribacter sp. TaxID=174711 RepID=UPI00261AA2DC|nr:CIA30 family protein [uncultured Polaribacter sp.]